MSLGGVDWSLSHNRLVAGSSPAGRTSDFNRVLAGSSPEFRGENP
jgi:hypothetical protein